MDGVCDADSAATLDPAPLAALFAQIEGAPIHAGRVGMGTSMTSKVALVRIVAGQLAYQTPESMQPVFHERASAASAMTGSSELGNTGWPVTTRRHTLTVSAMTTQRMMVSSTARNASNR